jgi:hypothetical protein
MTEHEIETETPVEVVSKFQIRAIPASLVERLWPNVEAYIKRALDHANGEFLPSDIKYFCVERLVQLWVITEGTRVVGAATTEIVNYPQRRHCRVITLSGNRAPEWTGQLDTILTTWALQQGCSAIEAYVRKGYVKVLGAFGYEHKYSCITKEIQSG